MSFRPAVILLDVAAAFVGGLAGFVLRNPSAVDFASWSWTYRVGGEPFPLDWGRLSVVAGIFAAATALTQVAAARLPSPLSGRPGSIGRWAVAALAAGPLCAPALLWGGLRPHNMPLSTLVFMALAAFALQAGWRIALVLRRKESRSPMLRSPGRTANLVLLAAAALTGLAFVEAGLRVAGNPFGLRVKGDKVHLPANVSRVYESRRADLEPRITYTRNALGLRGPMPPSEPEFSRVLTVAAVGGSTTEENFVSDDKVWTARLDVALSKAFPARWIGNAGISGHSTVAHQLLLDDFVVPLAPKVALFLVGINDMIIDEGAVGHDRSVFRTQMGEPLWLVLTRHLETAQLADALMRQMAARTAGMTSITLTGEPQALLEASSSDGSEADEILGRVARALPAYRARVRRLIETAKAGGVRPVLITQPLLWGEGRDPSSGKALGREAARLHGIDTSSAIYWKAMELYNDELRTLGSEAGIPVIDLARRMPKDTALYLDQMHYSHQGSQRVADIIAGELCPVLAGWFPELAAAPCPF